MGEGDGLPLLILAVERPRLELADADGLRLEVAPIALMWALVIAVSLGMGAWAGKTGPSRSGAKLAPKSNDMAAFRGDFLPNRKNSRWVMGPKRPVAARENPWSRASICWISPTMGVVM
jgi:hypothetical protein